MDEAVIRAMEKWPDVPAVWGWLSLDRRGVWKLRGETIPNRAVLDVIGRNYASDRDGRWFFQNGPQRVFVELAYTPWVYSLDGRGALVTHTGLDCGTIESAWIDEAGTMILVGEPGPGIVDDRDLLALSDRLVDGHGGPVDEDALATFIASPPGSEPELRIEYGGNPVQVGRIGSGEVPGRLGFDPRPAGSVAQGSMP